MSSHDVSRRSFIQTTAAATVGLGVAGSASLHAQGANDRIVLAVIGTNGRGAQHAKMFSRMPGVEVGFICDPDEKALAKGMKAVSPTQANPAKAEKDFRRVLERKDVDGVLIAAPDHWHAPAAILALAAGKDVFVEKPCSHNPLETELLAAAAKRYGTRVLQVGSQRRSWPNIIDLMRQVRDGSLIGRVYFARGWYVNTRASIGVGKEAPVPAGLDYELWQGPAPRRPYKDNVIHYNWHWFWHWGTSEACNNGNHEIDVMRWGMDVGYPVRVESAGGRYHFTDDWECADTQVATFSFEGNKSFIWEGRSCNGFRTEGLARGVTFHGENGSVLIDDHAYTVLRPEDEGREEGRGQGRAVNHRHHRPGRPPRRVPHEQLHRLHALAQDAQRAHRGGPAQRHAVPPREHRVPRGPYDPVRPEERPRHQRPQGPGALGPHV